MYKFRIFVSLAALAFCLNGYHAYGMEEEGDKQKLTLMGVRGTDQRLSRLTNLTELAVLKTDLTGRTLKAHTNLTTLDLNECPTFQEEYLPFLSNLTTFSMNGLTPITGCTLASLSHLTTLEIMHGVSTFNEEFLQDLTQLTTLNLHNNPFITGRTTTNLTNLKKLYIGTNVGDDGDGQNFEGQYLRQLTTLEYLDLGENFVTEERNPAMQARNTKIQDEDIQFLTCLADLDLQGNSFITDKGLVGLTNLTELNLCENPNITGKGLAELPNLTSLDLGLNTKITNEDLAACTSLTGLNLYKNPMITIDTLYKLPKLVSAGSIRDSRITREELEIWEIYKSVRPQIQLLMMMGLLNNQ